MPARSIERLRAALLRGLKAHNLPLHVPSQDLTPPRIIALCRGSRLSLLVQACAPNNVLCAMTERAAIDLALSDVAEVVILDKETIGPRAEAFIETLRAHPDLTDVPVLALAATYDEKALLDAGANAILGLDDVATQSTLLGHAYRDIRRLRGILRAAKRQSALAAKTDDSLALSHISAAAAETDAYFALALLRLLPLSSGKNIEFDDLINQTALQILSTLTRAEDLVTLCSDHCIALLLPDVSESEAERAIERLAGVCRNSALIDSKGIHYSGLAFAHAIVSAHGPSQANLLWEKLKAKLSLARIG